VVKICTPLAWTWYVLVGTAVCVSVGYVASLVLAPARPAAAGAGP
jgi:hypothetical protein